MRIAQGNFCGILFLVTYVGDSDFVAGTEAHEFFLQFGHLVDFFAVDGGDDVAFLQTGVRSCTVAAHFGHIDTLDCAEIDVFAFFVFLHVNVGRHV